MSNHDYKNVEVSANGQWKHILSVMACLSDKELTNKHQPCPSCGGNDRYRFDDKDGTGSYICGQCGAGTGINLLMKVTGMDFPTAVNSVGEFLMLDPSQYQPITPNRPRPKPITERKKNFIDRDEALSWVSRAEKFPICKLTAHHFFAPSNLLMDGDDIIVPVYGESKDLVNAARISEDCSVCFASGHFTYGGVSMCGNSKGRSVFICADWIDAWITATATNCKVICTWSTANFDDVARRASKAYDKLYLALNNDFDELASSEYCGLPCIIPDGANTIRDARAFKKKLFSVQELLDDAR